MTRVSKTEILLHSDFVFLGIPYPLDGHNLSIYFSIQEDCCKMFISIFWLVFYSENFRQRNELSYVVPMPTYAPYKQFSTFLSYQRDYGGKGGKKVSNIRSAHNHH
jgi:hypothetical protein